MKIAMILLALTITGIGAPQTLAASFSISQKVPETTKTQPTPALKQSSLSKNDELPQTGSALPLLSCIGAGAMAGGLVSALKLRRSRQEH